ncbi:MAG TPA: hypothetical protein VGG39_14410 [Polyangiaceae bacterium]|jgi:hypothetical protein
MPASAVLVAVLVVTWPLLAWPLRSRFGARAWMIPPLASLALVPFVALFAALAYGEPLVDTDRVRCGLGEMAFVIFLIPCMGGALGVGALWARYVAAPPGRRGVDATMRVVASCTVAAAAVLAVHGAFRSMHAPDADGWAASLPVDESPPPEVTRTAFEHFAWSFYDVRHDDARGLWVVTRPGGGSRVATMALGPALVPRTVLPRDLAGIAPPRGWVVEALGGVAAALAAMALGLAFARRYVRQRSGAEGFHVGDGWVSLAEGTVPLHVPALAAAFPCPVVLRLGATGVATYRTAGAPATAELLTVGTHESVRDVARSIAGIGFVTALAIVALASAPLAVA